MLDLFFFSRNKLKWTQYPLMIVDVEEEFLPYPNKSHHEAYIEARKKTISNIVEDILRAKDNWEDIILIEYKWCNPTVWELEKHLGKYPFTVFKKDAQWLLRSSEKIRKKIIKKLDRLNESEIKLVWINASACVKDTASSLLDNSYNVKVLARSIMNATDIEWESDNFLSKNKIPWIFFDYKEDTGYEWEHIIRDCKSNLTWDWVPIFTEFPRDISKVLEYNSYDHNNQKYIWEL